MHRMPPIRLFLYGSDPVGFDRIIKNLADFAMEPNSVAGQNSEVLLEY